MDDKTTKNELDGILNNYKKLSTFILFEVLRRESVA